MNLQELRKKKPMKYWSLPKGTNYQNRFKQKLKDGNYILSKKMDGALYRYSIGDKDAILQSRTISRKTGVLVEKQDNVPAIMEQLSLLPKNTMVVGEICFLGDAEKTSKNIVSIMGCLPNKAIRRQEKNPVQYYIFDILMYDGVDLSNSKYEDRIKVLEKIKNFYEFGPLVKIADFYYNDIEETVADFLDRGFEGGVLMAKDGKYNFGKRPAWVSIKIKQELAETLDLVIMDFTEPVKVYTGKYPRTWQYWENIKTDELVEGNYYDQGGFQPVTSNYFKEEIGGFVLGAYHNNKLVQVCKVANLTDEIREKASKNKKDFLNKVVKVQAMSVDSELRSLRHPNLVGFHPDKNPEECLYAEIWR